MKVFITGGTGFIGSVVVERLVDEGHEVVALNRSPEKAEGLETLGAAVHPGDLGDPSTYADAAAGADAVIHAAFDYSAAVEADQAALDALLAATAAGGRLIYTSGCWVVGDTGGEVAGDDYETDHPAELVAWRVPRERKVLDAAAAGRIAAVIRPGMVYGRSGSLTARLFETAVEAGASEYVGPGTNHWSMIHVEDLADLYALVLESGTTGIIQAVDGEPATVETIASAASRAAGAGGATTSVAVEKARERIGAMADALCLDQKLSAPNARALGWEPTRMSFVAGAGRAYAEWVASR